MFSVIGLIVMVVLLLLVILACVKAVKEQESGLALLTVPMLVAILVVPIQIDTIKVEPVQSVQLKDRVLFVVEDTVITYKDIETYNNYKNVTISKEVYKSLVGLETITNYTVTVIKDTNVHSKG